MERSGWVSEKLCRWNGPHQEAEGRGAEGHWGLEPRAGGGGGVPSEQQRLQRERWLGVVQEREGLGAGLCARVRQLDSGEGRRAAEAAGARWSGCRAP